MFFSYFYANLKSINYLIMKWVNTQLFDKKYCLY